MVPMAFAVDVKKAKDHHCGVLLHVQEDNVSAAIIQTSAADASPLFLWTYQEPVPPAGTDRAANEKRLFIAVMNVFAELGNSGLAALRKRGITALPTLVQVSLSFPGAYTIAKNVVLRPEAPVRITHALVRELETRAMKEVHDQAAGEIVAGSLNLSVLSNSTAAISLNGYPTVYPFKSSAAEITLCQVVGLGPTALVAHILKCKDKVLPAASVDMDSFMSLYYRAVTELLPKTVDACLVTANTRTVELMLIRDSLPQSSTIVSLEKALPAAAPARPLGESLRDLFQKTGDGLSLPKQIYLYVENGHDPAFAALLQKTANDVTKTTHLVSLVDKAFEDVLQLPGSYLTVQAYIYHKKLYADRHLEQL